MDLTVYASFLLLAVPAFFTPGPNNLMLMASGARFGVRRTVPHGAGVVFGFPLMVFLVGLGLGAVLTTYPWLKTILKYLSALYFLWMAWHLLGLKIGQVEASARPMRMYEAMLFQWVNPKGWVMAVSFVGAFVEPGPGRWPGMALVVLGCLSVVPLSSILWAMFGQQLQQFLIRTGGERYLGGALAVAMLAAVVLILL